MPRKATPIAIVNSGPIFFNTLLSIWGEEIFEKGLDISVGKEKISEK